MGRDRLNLWLGAKVIGIYDGLVLNKIHYPSKGALNADGHLQGERLRAQSITDHLYCAPVVRPDAIHFVNKADPWHPETIGLVPYSLGLWFDTSHGIENDYASVQDPQTALDLCREIDVAWRIDNVDLIVVPETTDCSSRDGNATFTFLLHPVRDSGPIVDTAYAIRTARVEEDTLRRRGLACIDVRDDAYVSDPP
jgi:hypothetical protein